MRYNKVIFTKKKAFTNGYAHLCLENKPSVKNKIIVNNTGTRTQKHSVINYSGTFCSQNFSC